MSLAFHIVFARWGSGCRCSWPSLRGCICGRSNRCILISASGGRRAPPFCLPVGAVSGTVLSFELGLLWPGFMEHCRAIIGMPFSLEGFAFFTEAISGCLSLRLEARFTAHSLDFRRVVAMSGISFRHLVVTAKRDERAHRIPKSSTERLRTLTPSRPMLNPGLFSRVAHMTLAHLWLTGFMVRQSCLFSAA